MPRLVLVVVLGLASAASAQGMDPCNQKCSDKMMKCIQSCGTEMKCSTRCQNQMQSCAQTCLAQPQAVTTGDAKKQCFGADGRRMPCGTYKPQKAPPRKLPTTDDPNDKEQYPNQAAKDLAKDPNFKGAVPAE